VLKNNGGLRFEYNSKHFGDRIFKDSLRTDGKSKLKYFRDEDKSDITNYLNWQSISARRTKTREAKITDQLVKRLTTGSPNRETTI